MRDHPCYAYIFDFDGVLVNTMNAHFECYRQALADAGVPIDRAQFYRQAGMTGIEQIQYFLDQAGVKGDAQMIYRRKKDIWASRRLATDRIACNLELLRLLRRSGVKVAIATGSSIGTVAAIMQEHGMEVDAIVTADDVQRGKPFPDLFLCAAQKLGEAPSSCVVVEDSDVGIEAASAAGMKALRFYSNEPKPNTEEERK